MRKIHIILLLPVILFFGACKKEADKIGPEYITLSDDFRVQSILVPAYKEVDLSSQKQFFKAEFSSKVSWTITLIGQTSKAVKKISGLSSNINESNSQWDGGHEDLKFFTSEKVTATLEFLGSDLEYHTEFIITEPKFYEELSLLGNGFEEPLESSMYFDPGENNQSGIITESGVQGRFALRLIGEDRNRSYYCGVYRKTFAGGEKLSENPSDVYFNVYVKGQGSKNSMLKLAGKEDDRDDFTYNDESDDSWEFVIPLDFSGWKLISVRYSDFVRSSEKLYGGSGNGIKEPKKIVAVDFALLAATPGASVEVILDAPSITVGQAFQK